MDFRTKLSSHEITKPHKTIDYQSSILLIGSCFVENMGQKMTELQFDTLVNPYGVLFHPLAIERALRDIVSQRIYAISDLIFDQGLWHSTQHHSDFSDPEAANVIQKINKTLAESHAFLKKTSHVIITLGTAWVYHHLPTDTLVANCHKIPQNQFTKRLLTTEEIKESIRNTNQLLQQTNPNLQIIWTLSPVRHLRDGMQHNAWSKARLLESLHQVLEERNTTNPLNASAYFPAYEILMDDLRDYRYYKDDLLHPSEMAVQYIWEYFEAIHFTPETQAFMAEVAQIRKAEAHKPFHPDSAAHHAFLTQLKERKEQLTKNIEKKG